MKTIKKALALVLTLAMTVALLPVVSTNAATVTTKYEAEDTICCDYSNCVAGVNQWTGNASGGKSVTARPQEQMIFTVSVEKAGTYDVAVRYGSGNNTGFQTVPVSVSAGNGEATTYDFPNTGLINNGNGYNTFSTEVVSLDLAAGENKITVRNDNVLTEGQTWPFINVDYIEVTEVNDEPEVYPAAIGRHEAEAAQNLNNNTIQGDQGYYANCSGKAVVGVSNTWIGNAKDFVEWTVDADKAGQYKITLQYCCPKQAEFMSSVNGGEWTVFTETENEVGKVAPATGDWNIVGTVYTVVTLQEGTNTIAVSGPIVDNKTGDGNFFTVFGSNWANTSSANLDCIDIEEYAAPGPVVTVDGTPIEVTDGKITLPTEAGYGYYCEGNMYKAGAEVEVTADMTFTAVNELSVSFAYGAGIRLVDDEDGAGIRFQATVASDNMTAVASDAIKEGMLLTANDIYETLGNSTLDLTSAYTFKTLENVGWYNDTVGTYCGSMVKIIESNYIRKFIARAYVTITYTDGEKLTIYSTGISEARSIQNVAEAIKNAGYPNIAAEFIPTIDKFAAVK